MPHALQVPARRWMRKSMMPQWLESRWFRDMGVAAFSMKSGGGSDLFRKNLCDALVGGGLAHLLRYEDRNSMCHSIESRVPFLTPKLAQYVISLPERYLVSGGNGETKSVFRGGTPPRHRTRHSFWIAATKSALPRPSVVG